MNNTKAIAQAFVGARAAGRPLDAFPLAQPATLAEAYAVQEDALTLAGARPVGWKLAAIRPEFQEALGANRLAGPIVRLIDVRDTSAPAEVAVIPDGFAAVEAEIAIHLGQDLPLRSSPWSEEEVVAAIASMHIASEIAGSPLATLNDLGPTAVISDHGNNTAVVVGAAIPNWQQLALDEITCRSSVDGQEVGQGDARRVPGGPLGALRFLVEHLASRGRFLKRGDWISTGAMTGIHPVTAGAVADLDFGSLGKLRIRITAA